MLEISIQNGVKFLNQCEAYQIEWKTFEVISNFMFMIRPIKIKSGYKIGSNVFAFRVSIGVRKIETKLATFVVVNKSILAF